MSEKRKVLDCRWFPDSHCSLALSGSQQEVIDATVEHGISCHGEKDTPEFRERIRSLLRDATD